MGFFVLLGLIAYVVMAKFIVKAIGKYSESKVARYGAIAVFVLIPTWDIVPGQAYFHHLCRKDAGVKVFKTVQVEKAYFLPNGEPDQKKLAERFEGPLKFDDEFSRLFHIRMAVGSVVEKQTGETLGTATNLSHFGGWVAANLFPQGPPDNCPGYSVYSDLWKSVIKPEHEATAGEN